MSDWHLLNKGRVSRSADNFYGSSPSDGFNGFFCLLINGLPIKCIASDGQQWQHVSVSIHGSSMTPSWSIMCKVKELFWDAEDWVCQFHPAESEYVNMHPGCLHLWRYTGGDFPKPDRLMVGVRDEADMRKVNADPHAPVKFAI